MTLFLLGSMTTTLAAIVAIPAVVLELRERGKSKKDLPLLVDVKTIFGVRLRGMEIFWAGILIHLVMGFLFGFLYEPFAQMDFIRSFVSPYTLASLMVYTGVVWLATIGVCFPLFGMGFFGRREGKWVWLEVLISLMLLAFGSWIIIQWFWPVWFSVSPII